MVDGATGKAVSLCRHHLLYTLGRSRCRMESVGIAKKVMLVIDFEIDMMLF